LAAAHLALCLGSAVLVCVPVPAEAALPADEAGAAVERATSEALTAGIVGPQVTPWLLARVAILTEGRSARANRALIVNDARVAGELAVALAKHETSRAAS
jgi:pseudouridine-5'-phosphate glycosidase